MATQDQDRSTEGTSGLRQHSTNPSTPAAAIDASAHHQTWIGYHPNLAFGGFHPAACHMPRYPNLSWTRAPNTTNSLSDKSLTTSRPTQDALEPHGPISDPGMHDIQAPHSLRVEPNSSCKAVATAASGPRSSRDGLHTGASAPHPSCVEHRTLQSSDPASSPPDVKPSETPPPSVDKQGPAGVELPMDPAPTRTRVQRSSWDDLLCQGIWFDDKHVL